MINPKSFFYLLLLILFSGSINSFKAILPGGCVVNDPVFVEVTDFDKETDCRN